MTDTYRRSLLTLLMALFLGFAMVSLVACGGSSSSSSESAEATEQADANAENEQVTEAEAAPPVAASDYTVTIDGARLATNYEGGPAVIVSYTFTNNSDEAESFATACNTTVYQNGVQCQVGMPGTDTDYNSEGYMQKAKTGATTTCELLYDLQDTTSPIEVEVEEMFSFDEGLLAEKTINLQ